MTVHEREAMAVARSSTPKAPPVGIAAGAIPEGKVVDFLTGKYVNDTPEEYVRQNVEKALVRQYRYSPEDCHPEFRIKVGRSAKRVDIVLFSPKSTHTQEDAYALVETKKPGTSPQNKKDGIDQLKSYMAACLNAKYGLWTNGDDRFCFAKRSARGQLKFDEIIDIPSMGQSESETDRPKRRDLMPATADNLLFAFRRCHNYIAGTEGMQKPDAFWELLKLTFCKIEDERSGILSFWVTPSELSSATAAGAARARVQELFTKKVVRKYPRIFPKNDREIALKPNVLAYVVSQLQRYSLLESPVDVKGVAYEEIVGSNLRGDRGEFFTPRNACRMAVRMVGPRPSETLLDPACGTGGFLIIAMNHALGILEHTKREQWADREDPTDAERQELYRKRVEYLNEMVFGIDLNPALVRAAKMNMVMNNDGEGGLFQGNSLANAHTWQPELAKRVPLGSVDVLFTNPPFGAKIVIDDEHVLAQYELAAGWDESADGVWTMRQDSGGRTVLQASQPPEILFIERCVQFLKPGTGRMAIVIPNGILNNPALGYVRQWLLRNCQVMAVADMARELFHPKNDTQTSMVLLRRLNAEEERLAGTGQLDYSVFMAVAEKIGHDKRGNALYRQTPEGDDLLVSRVEEVREIRSSTGAEVTGCVEVSERVVDDDLPDVASAYLEWLESLS